MLPRNTYTMKITLTTTIMLLASNAIYAQNVGIATATPTSKLHVIQTEIIGHTVNAVHNILTNPWAAVNVDNLALGDGIL